MVYGKFKFISTPSEISFGNVRTNIEHTIMDTAVSLDEILEEFQRFLLACGYSFSDGEYIGVVNPVTESGMAALVESGLEDVNRVEVIDAAGRSYTNYGAMGASLSLQDNDETLKVFVNESYEEDMYDPLDNSGWRQGNLAGMDKPHWTHDES